MTPWSGFWTSLASTAPCQRLAVPPFAHALMAPVAAKLERAR